MKTEAFMSKQARFSVGTTELRSKVSITAKDQHAYNMLSVLSPERKPFHTVRIIWGEVPKRVIGANQPSV